MTYSNVTAQDLFQCQQCGDCCRGYGGTIVSQADIEAIAAYLDIPSADFVRQYCVYSGKRPLLKQGSDGYCHFWDGLCTIHPVKPRMCKAWPFLESILVDAGNWEAMSACCPGMRTEFPPEIIQQCVQQELAKNNDRHI